MLIFSTTCKRQRVSETMQYYQPAFDHTIFDAQDRQAWNTTYFQTGSQCNWRSTAVTWWRRLVSIMRVLLQWLYLTPRGCETLRTAELQ